jgi:hypothetical protein
MKQYDLDTERVVMVENPDGAYVLTQEARELVRMVADLREEVKRLEDRLGALELIFNPSKESDNLCDGNKESDKPPKLSDHIFFR